MRSPRRGIERTQAGPRRHPACHPLGEPLPQPLLRRPARAAAQPVLQRVHDFMRDQPDPLRARQTVRCCRVHEDRAGAADRIEGRRRPRERLCITDLQQALLERSPVREQHEGHIDTRQGQLPLQSVQDECQCGFVGARSRAARYAAVERDRHDLDALNRLRARGCQHENDRDVQRPAGHGRRPSLSQRHRRFR